MAESLAYEWRPDGSLVITCTELKQRNGENLRLLFVPSSVEELQKILSSKPEKKVAGQYERGPGV